MKRIIILLRNLIVLGTLLSIFAHLVRSATLSKDNSIINKSIVLFSKVPEKTHRVLRQLYRNQSTMITVNKDNKLINELDYDLYVVNSKMEKRQNIWKTQLRNLKNDSLLHEWQFTENNYENSGRLFKKAYPLSPIVLKDKSLIALFNESNNLLRVDKESNIIWKNTDREYHHTMNLDADGHLWVCSRDKGYVEIKPSNNYSSYIDDAISKIDVQTGKVIFHKNISEMLIENDYAGILYGSMNSNHELSTKDPIHLNDIEPAFEDSDYWNKGDLFISIRNRSSIIQYRPSVDSIITILQGPFIVQHDVDILNNHTIGVFNNNAPTLRNHEDKSSEQLNYSVSSSDIITYDFNNQRWSTTYKNIFDKERIFTMIQGGFTTLSNGDIFVESNDQEQVYIFNDDKLIYKGYSQQPKNSLAPECLWMRVYEDINF